MKPTPLCALPLALPLVLALRPPGLGNKEFAVPVSVDSVSAEDIKALHGVDLQLPNVDMAVGRDRVVQTTTLTVRGFNKQAVQVYVDGVNTAYKPLGAPYYTGDDDDSANHQVEYDALADRYVFFKMPKSGGHAAFAVTQGPDPAGPYHLYGFPVNVPLSGDNPRLSVGPEGYFVSYDVYDPTGSTYYGYHILVGERTKMIVGDPNASWQQFVFPTTGVPPTHENLVPASMGRWGPPPGAPFTFAQKFDDQVQGNGSGSDGIYTWSVKLDWAVTSNSTITGSFIPTSDFDSQVGGLPQVGGTTLDPRADRLDSLQYWNHGAYESLVGSHTVNLGGRAGVQWFELRDSGAGWGLHQEGTYSPDSSNRWTSSIAQNEDGDMALGFSVSSNNLFPSLRYTSRRAGDPLGAFTGPEFELASGSAVPTGSAWGAYSALSVDPSDYTTFWFSGEYGQGTGTNAWSTRVAALTATGGPEAYCTAKLNSCGTYPQLYYYGAPSATVPAGFQLGVNYMPAGKAATYLYTVGGRTSLPFEGGTLCIKGYLRRTPVLRDTVGTPGACDGFISFDMNAFTQGLAGGHPAPFLRQPGIRINGQVWGRDSWLNGSFLSDAVEFYQGP